MTTQTPTSVGAPFDATKLQRPDPKLFHYYLWCALLTGPLSPILFLSFWFRYSTLKYKFDDTGVSMSWGVLFKQEVYLTYRRIQDIHLTRNLLQRWMGLAKISLQTASGSSKAEMSIEGILQAEELRDFLYSRMRGAKNDSAAVKQVSPDGLATEQTPGLDHERATRALEEIRDALKTLVEKRGA
ncbi:MAG: PH domain-containing protein [Pirellulaceae bacterium]|nr:PH domain-containing protein [Pirellulaceae bacterium]